MYKDDDGKLWQRLTLTAAAAAAAAIRRLKGHRHLRKGRKAESGLKEKVVDLMIMMMMMMMMMMSGPNFHV